MSDVSLIQLLEDKGVMFMSGGGGGGDEASIDFMYSDPGAPGVVAAAKVWTEESIHLDELFDEACQWLGDGFSHIFEMPDETIDIALDALLKPLREAGEDGTTGQRLTVAAQDDFWTYAAYVREGGTHVLWVAFGAQNLTIPVVKEVADAFAEAHNLDKQEPVLH